MPLARKLCVLTGVPGSGKSSAANLIGQSLTGDWSVVHADDFIGPTFEWFRPKPWGEIRQYHTIFAGWSAGWHLSQGRNVLVEGHIKDRKELRHLIRSAAERYDGPTDRRLIWLDGDVEEIVDRLTTNPFREPDWIGPDRPSKFRYWITEWAVEPAIADVVVDGRGRTSSSIAAEIAAHFGIELTR